MEAPFPVTFFFLSLSLTHARAHNNNPEQIHIAFTGFPSERIINYVTPSPYEKPDTVAVYGTSADKLDKKAYGVSFVFPGPGHKFTIHNVKHAWLITSCPSDSCNWTYGGVPLTGLKSNTRYYYQVGNPDNGCSEIFSFSTKDGNLIFAVYGDLGSRNAVSLDRLKTEAKNGEYDAIFHVGDFAYDMDEKKGQVGDDFMNAIQPIASRVPYMVLPGNHENKDNFTQYLNRFSNIELGVGQTSGSQTSLWWSMDIGLIHFVCFDTEVYSFYPDKGQIQRQLNWLEADLIKANKQRAKTPWIVSLAHKGFFMEKTRFSHFGPLLHKYGVDLHICGHRHNYQRLYPTYRGKVQHEKRKHKYVNPAYMTTIVAGSAGGEEKLSHSTAPTQMVAKYLKNYGYGHLQAINRTHLHWKWENIHSKSRSVFRDHLWIVQENHGRRDRPMQVYQEDNIKQLINDIIQEYEDDIRTGNIC